VKYMFPSGESSVSYSSHPDPFGSKRYVQVFFDYDLEAPNGDRDCPVTYWKTWDYPWKVSWWTGVLKAASLNGPANAPKGVADNEGDGQ
jgi:hypothetical protein